MKSFQILTDFIMLSLFKTLHVLILSTVFSEEKKKEKTNLNYWEVVKLLIVNSNLPNF